MHAEDEGEESDEVGRSEKTRLVFERLRLKKKTENEDEEEYEARKKRIKEMVEEAVRTKRINQHPPPREVPSNATRGVNDSGYHCAFTVIWRGIIFVHTENQKLFDY